MLVCGLKLTHDGGLALIDGDTLVCSIEMEKLDNNPRFQPLDRLELVGELLASAGVGPADVDRFVVDGWTAAPGEDAPVLRVTDAGRPVAVPVAPYHERADAPPLRRYAFEGLPLAGRATPYTSHHHATQHVLGSYCTGPFAERGEPALVLVWDGGMRPRLYRVEPDPFEITPLGPLLPVLGSAFADFAAELPPFRAPDADRARPWRQGMPPHLDVAGKAMAFAALGRDEPDFHPVLDDRLQVASPAYGTAAEAARWIDARRRTLWPGCTDADLIATLQGFLGARLLEALRARIAPLHRDPAAANLCLAGGCFLNIKWNSLLRRSGLFHEVWVPPFPNDSGAALGAALAETVATGRTRLRWDVRSGPALRSTAAVPGRRAEPCDAAGLARYLHRTGEPVVVLRGHAELGPRALGGRSILAPATDPKTKALLNEVKDREDYRPVAPVCREERAPEVFDPGLPDPYMLFDHVVRPRWAERVPAVVHLDGTARLQTVNAAQDPFLHQVLVEYERLSGVPVLCNTSANHKGRGFFPDLRSAAEWDRVDALWGDGLLHRRQT
ncbi:carbamoyltransferase N-terminal domain-containing protein [Streptomyces sp. HB2AG]|uniref:carbamoyltransferase N-terminal domain-containing protein n=1 Tax=Streptomyces sp. HB2AG TaxID=2983400 RepID=UPI0022AAC544|nr:carbamoyltransferase N-terminal domain-containing protein [Streptomyces sp. HB2AG]MCZ2523485.1 nodulation protein U [Streptomyces sp. HB2AG]